MTSPPDCLIIQQRTHTSAGPLQSAGAQFDKIGQIGLKPALLTKLEPKDSIVPRVVCIWSMNSAKYHTGITNIRYHTLNCWYKLINYNQS